MSATATNAGSGSAQTMSGRAWIELGLLSLLWGGSFFSIAIALREIGPFTAVLHRVGWAALLLWVIVLARGCAVPKNPQVWGAFLIMGCLNNVIPFSLMSWGQTHVESGLVSIFNAMTAPLGVLVAACLLSDERLTLNRAGGVLLAFAGACIVIGLDNIANLDIRALGQWAVIAGALSYAFASVWAKVTLRGIDPMVAAAGMLTGSTLVMLPVASGLEGLPTLALQANTWAAIGYYAIFATALAYLLYYRVLGMAGAGNLMLCTLLIPPVAIFLGWAFLDERLLPQAFFGFAVIALGLILIDGRILRRRKHAG
ncbi:MAG: DMT family transporter [Pseudomonadota bacterium]